MSDSNDQVAFVAPDPAVLNELFPGYEIQGLIATGGMGAVYCAVQKSLDRTVALKILPHEFSKDAAFCEGFEAEAKAMARLNHPNLIGVYDFGEVGGMLFIIMEFVPGKSVYHSAHGQAIDAGEVIRLVTGVCHGLAHAHENGIIHRDIKPSNILLDLNAQPKIGDFGLARPIERKIQEGEEIFGTPHYTAPEVVNAPQSVDYRADIFSVGVMLHELLTGKLPADDPRPPSAISRCDPRFDNIVRRATNPSPAARYSSAAEMAKDLAQIAASGASRVPRPANTAAMGPNGPRVAGPIRPRRPVKVKKSSHSSSVVMLLLLGAIGYGAFLFFSKPQTPAKPTPETPPKDEPVQVEPTKSSTTAPVEPTPETATDTPSETALNPAPAPTAGMPVEPADEPVVAPESSDPAEPKFDVPAFFQRARKIMQDKAKFQVSDRASSLKGNVSEFGRALKRQVRKVDKNKDLAENRLDKFLEKLTEEGSVLPTEVDESLVDIPGAEETFTEYLEKQTAIEEAFQKSLFTLSGTYILGLEKQIERLKADKDDAAIKPIEDEIRITKEAPKHFADLILGVEPEN